MFALFKKEINTYLSSPVAYIFLAVFLLLAGVFTWFFEGNILDFGYADLDVFFKVTPFIFIFLIPALSMKSFSDEYKSGTIELLFTKPISDISIVLAKYLSILALIVLALLPTLVYYYTIYQLGSPKGNIDTAAVIGSYIGLILLGAVFGAIGLWSSSLTDNSIIAFVIGSLLSFFIFEGLSQIADLFSGVLQYTIHYLSVSFHFEALSRGVLDSRNLIYLFSLSLIMLYLTKISLETRKN